MMKKTGVLAAALAGLAMVMAPQMSMARTVPGNSMLPTNNPRLTYWNCIEQWYNAALSGCANLNVYIPLVVDSGGAKTVTVTAWGPSSSANVGCTAAAAYEGGNTWSTSNTGYLAGFGSWQTITLTGASVPAGGSLAVYCNLGNGARVDVVNYNP